jgi:hypothetical protein
MSGIKKKILAKVELVVAGTQGEAIARLHI